MKVVLLLYCRFVSFALPTVCVDVGWTCPACVMSALTRVLEVGIDHVHARYQMLVSTLRSLLKLGRLYRVLIASMHIYNLS